MEKRCWEDPTVFDVGKEPAHATLFAAETRAIALAGRRASSAPSAATSRLPFRLPGRSAMMRHACGLIGMTSLLLPYMINSPWIAQHGHFNYLDALFFQGMIDTDFG